MLKMVLRRFQIPWSCRWSGWLCWWCTSIQNFIQRCITSAMLPSWRCTSLWATMSRCFQTSCPELVSDSPVVSKLLLMQLLSAMTQDKSTVY